MGKARVIAKHFQRLLAILGAVALLAVVTVFFFFLGIGHWLVKEDPLQRADAIAVLSDPYPRIIDIEHSRRAGRDQCRAAGHWQPIGDCRDGQTTHAARVHPLEGIRRGSRQCNRPRREQ